MSFVVPKGIGKSRALFSGEMFEINSKTPSAAKTGVFEARNWHAGAAPFQNPGLAGLPV
jgi:hypothetical protein